MRSRLALAAVIALVTLGASLTIYWPSFSGPQVKSALQGFHFSTIDVPGATSTSGSRSREVHTMSSALSADEADENDCEQPRFETIDITGARLTEVKDVNRWGDLVGVYIMPNAGTTSKGLPVNHGFLRTADGTLSTLDFPNAPFNTPSGINAAGDIVGGFIGADGLAHSYLFQQGEFRQIDVGVGFETFAGGIDSEGKIIGAYCESPCNPFDFRLGSTLHGFFMDGAGQVETFDFPGATTTGVVHFNSRGDTVGFYRDSAGMLHGFKLGRKGDLSTIDVAGATGTMGLGINRHGTIVGAWCGSSPCFFSRNHAFMLTSHGPHQSIATFDFPGAAFTRAWDINDDGEIVGVFVDPANRAHGFTISCPSDMN